VVVLFLPLGISPALTYGSRMRGGVPRLKDRDVRTVLYYPYISVKNGPWLRHALLYWDGVSSIVPDSFDEPGARRTRSPEIEYLESQGLFSSVYPRHILGGLPRPVVDDNISEFLSMVDSPNFAEAREEPRTWHLHADKVSLPLIEGLEGRRLADRTRSWDWLLVGETLGLLYLSHLARLLCQTSHLAMVPGTDEQRYEGLLFPADFGERRACLSVAFQRILPVPADDVPLDVILQFREENRASLLRFRRELDRISGLLSECSSEHEVSQAVVGERENLELQLLDLEAALKRARISGRLGNWKSLLGLAGAGVAATFSTPVGAAGAVVTVANSHVDTRGTREMLLSGSPLAYVFNARREGILL
jgi:hypothetical protein